METVTWEPLMLITKDLSDLSVTLKCPSFGCCRKIFLLPWWDPLVGVTLRRCCQRILTKSARSYDSLLVSLTRNFSYKRIDWPYNKFSDVSWKSPSRLFESQATRSTNFRYIVYLDDTWWLLSFANEDALPFHWQMDDKLLFWDESYLTNDSIIWIWATQSDDFNQR